MCSCMIRIVLPSQSERVVVGDVLVPIRTFQVSSYRKHGPHSHQLKFVAIENRLDPSPQSRCIAIGTDWSHHTIQVCSCRKQVGPHPHKSTVLLYERNWSLSPQSKCLSTRNREFSPSSISQAKRFATGQILVPPHNLFLSQLPFTKLAANPAFWTDPSDTNLT